MTPQQQMELLLTAFNTIFTSKAVNTPAHEMVLQSQFIVGGSCRGRSFNDSTTGQPTLRGFDVDINTGNKIIQLRLLEQNPNKPSWSGKMAAQGSKIMWVIDRKVQNGYLGRIQDGAWVQSNTPAVTNRPPQQQTYSAGASSFPHNDLQDVPPDEGFAEFVEHYDFDEEDLPIG